MKNLTAVAKINLDKYFKNATLNQLTYDNLLKAVNVGRTKYNGEDIVGYLSDELYKVFTGTSSKKYATNTLDKMCVFLGGILYNMVKNDEKIDEIIISRVSVFPKLYETYCTTNNIEVNETFTKSLNSIKKVLKPEIEELNNKENDTGLLAKVASENTSLKEEKEKLLKELDKLKKANEEKDKIIEESSKTSEREEKQIEENKRLNKDLKTSATKRKEAENKAKELENSNNTLTEKVSKIEEEKEKLLIELEQIKTSQTFITVNLEKEKQAFDDKVISLLVEKEYSVNDIIKKLSSKGIKTNIYEVYDSLKRIQNKVNISNNKIITSEKLYRIQAPTVITDNILLFNPPTSDVKEFMFISDMHLKVDDDNLYAYKRMEQIYDYCAENGITDIINLGDVFDTNKNIKELNMENIEKKRKLIKQVSEKLYPDSLFNDIKKCGINHYILGGNHDLDFASMGVDPIEYITRENMGLISLGYDNAILRFGNEGSGDYIGLHHNGVPRDEKVNNDPIKSAELTLDYLKRYYEKRPYSYSQDYLDLFGHTHRGKLDALNGYGIVPSLNVDRYNDGAWHVKVYFDSNKRIDYIVIYPLNVKYDIHKAMELPYKKVRTK